jgi:hypothetical protein
MKRRNKKVKEGTGQRRKAWVEKKISMLRKRKGD